MSLYFELKNDGLINRCPRYMNAEKYNLDRIYFGGCFIRGMCKHMDDLVCALMIIWQDTQLPFLRSHMRFASGVREQSELCSSGTKDSCTYLDPHDLHRPDEMGRGSIGAWIRNIEPEEAE